MVDTPLIRPRFVDLWMDFAIRAAQMSYAERLKVGCVIVKEDRIISIGYNGTPAGWSNECEMQVGNEIRTRPEVLHAETNAIAKLAKGSDSGLGAILFTTHSPCMDCAKLIYQAGIKAVYYLEDYHNIAGIEFLQKTGTRVIKYKRRKNQSNDK